MYLFSKADYQNNEMLTLPYTQQIPVFLKLLKKTQHYVKFHRLI